VLRLECDGLVWYRHLEFQAQRDPDLPRRCFEYNSRLILHYDAAVLTTVLYLFPGADRDVPDAFRLYVGDWLAYEWRFDVVRLWELDAQSALESGEAGPLALVPLLRGGDDPAKVLEAVRMLDALPWPQSADAMSVLLDFASQRGTPPGRCRARAPGDRGVRSARDAALLGPAVREAARRGFRDARHGQAARAGRPLAGHPAVTPFIEAPLTGLRIPRTRPAGGPHSE